MLLIHGKIKLSQKVCSFIGTDGHYQEFFYTTPNFLFIVLSYGSVVVVVFVVAVKGHTKLNKSFYELRMG